MSCLIEDSVRTVVAVFPYLCLWRKSFYLSNTEKCPGGIVTSSGWIHWCTWTLDSSGTLKSVRTCCWDIQTDANLNYSKLLDTDGSPDSIGTSSRRILLTDECPDKNKGSDFSDLESAQNLPKIYEVAFLKLVILQLVIIRLFPYERNKLWISEEFEIYDISLKIATLHDSDFVNIMQPIKN